MKTNLTPLFFMSIPALILTSCKECPVDLSVDRCKNIIEAGEVCELYQSGEISEAEAVKKMDELTRQYRLLTEQLSVLLSEKENSSLDREKHQKDMIAFDRSTEAKVYKQKMGRAASKLRALVVDFFKGKPTSAEFIAAVERYNKVTELYHI